MKVIAQRQKEEDRTKAVLISVVFHAVLLALLFFMQVSVSKPIPQTPPIEIEWGGGGSEPAPGEPDKGQGNDPAPPGQQMENPKSTAPAEKPQPAPPTKTSTPPKPSAPAPAKTSTSSDPDVAAIRRAQEENKRRQQDADDERKRQETAERAEQDRARKEQEDRDKKKGAFGSTFGKPGSTGTGQGNTGKPGNQGQPGGTGTDPFGRGGTGTGSGGGDGSGVGESIGGGLGGRKVVGRPKMVDDTQYTGRVAVRVCVGSDGSVSSASYTLAGSTTNESTLRSKAESWARQYRFAPSGSSEQCGTISFDFRVK